LDLALGQSAIALSLRLAVDYAIERYAALLVERRLFQLTREDADFIPANAALAIAFQQRQKLRINHLGVSARKLPVADVPLVVPIP
jgi:hypothetical protein